MATVDEILNKIPEDRREAVRTFLADQADVAGALDEFVSAQKAEFSRGQDAIRAKHTEQDAWWQANRPLVELGRKAQEAGFVPGTTPPVPVPAPTATVVSREDFEAAQRDVVSFQAVTQKLGFTHLREFNEVLDLNTLLQDPNVKTMGLERAYDASVAARRQAAQKAATDAEVERRVAEGVAAKTRGMGNPQFPANVPPGSPLDALQPAPNQPGGVDEYVDAYNQIVAGGTI